MKPLGQSVISSAADQAVADEVLAAATLLFAKSGYSATTTERIAMRCGISKKTLYRLYDSKESLFRLVVANTLREITTDTDAVYRRTDLPPRERITLVMQRMMKTYDILGPAAVADIYRSCPDVWTGIVEWREGRIARFNALLDESIAAYDVRKRLSTDDLHVIYRAVLAQCTEYLISGESDVDPSVVYHTFLSIFFGGVLSVEYPE